MWDDNSAAQPSTPSQFSKRDFWRGVLAVLGILAIVATTVAVTISLTGRERPSDQTTAETAGQNSSDESRDDESLTSVFRKVQSGIVRIETLSCSGGSVGTGFLIDDTHVVTASHVVDDAVVISLSANDETVSGTVVGYSDSDDVALVKTNVRLTGHNFSFANRSAEVGDPVAAIGFPIGLPITLTVGTVSGLDRSVEIESSTYSGLLQTDAAVNPGNSGGPLINTQGHVVAIVDISRRDASGIAYGVPANTASSLVDGWRADPAPEPASQCGNATGTTKGRPQLEPPTSLPEKVGYGVAKAFNTYFNGINNGEFGTAFQVLSKRQRTEDGFTRFVNGVKSSFDFNQKVLAARQIDSKTVQVALAFTSLQDSSKGPEGQSCTRWTLDYRMVLESDGGWHIDGTKPFGGQSYEAC